MARDNFDACMAFTLRYEGGYVDHPRDPGGATNLGITIGTLSAWRGRKVSKAEVRALKKEEALQIYRKNYWDAVKGDTLPRGVDLVTCDYGINSGPARGRAAYVRSSNEKTPQAMIKRICAIRRSFVQGLKTWSTFGKGWSARIAACEALALKMAIKATGATGSMTQKELQREAKEAQTSADISAKRGKVTAGGAAATPAAPVAAGSDIEVWIFSGIIIVVLLGVAFMAWKSYHDEKNRAEAFLLEANNVEF